MTNKEIRLLENYKIDLLEDIEIYGPSTATCLFYKIIDNVKYFTGYEIAETNIEAYLETLTDQERTDYLKTVEEENKKGNNYALYNILYDGEQFEIVSPKELLYIIADILRPNSTPEIKAIYINMWLNKKPKMALAREIGISTQYLYMLLSGERPFTEKMLKSFIDYFKIEDYELTREKTLYQFNANI